jgi:DNA invertase Pin-like site-specific DNA recombinase
MTIRKKKKGQSKYNSTDARKTTQEDRDRIAALYRAGRTTPEVAEITGISKDAVSRYMPNSVKVRTRKLRAQKTLQMEDPHRI